MVPFVYLASVCWSLQCLISALTQAGGGGLLFRFTCSVMLRGGRGAADKSHWCVWGAPTVFPPHWVCPRSRVRAFLIYTAPVPDCSIWIGPWICAVPVFGSFTKAWTWLGLRFVPSLAQAAQAARSLTGALSPSVVCLLPSTVPASVSMCTLGAPCVCSAELVSSHDPPSGC